MERARLYPTPSQISSLEKILDVTRSVYNAALEQRITAYKRCGVSVTHLMQGRDLTELRAADARVASVYRECSATALHRLDKAFSAFFRRVKTGQSPGFPRFRSAERWNTFKFSHGAAVLRLNQAQTKVCIPGVGVVRLRKGRNVPTYGIASITRKAGRWYVLFECERAVEALPKTGAVVGLDRGIAVTCATSDGDMFSLPTTLDDLRHNVIVAQRRVTRRKKRGKNRAKARILLARAHERVTNVRRDFCHKLSRNLVDRYDTIVLEKLAITNMTRSAKGTVDKPGTNVSAKAGLNREILNAGWSILHTLILEKAECAARTIIEINPRNTSRECSACGTIDALSRRSQADYRCTACGHSENADINAAKVIKKRAELLPVGSSGALALGVDLRSALSSGRTRFALLAVQGCT